MCVTACPRPVRACVCVCQVPNPLQRDAARQHRVGGQHGARESLVRFQGGRVGLDPDHLSRALPFARPGDLRLDSGPVRLVGREGSTDGQEGHPSAATFRELDALRVPRRDERGHRSARAADARAVRLLRHTHREAPPPRLPLPSLCPHLHLLAAESHMDAVRIQVDNAEAA
jgi:hypothetical protein